MRHVIPVDTLAAELRPPVLFYCRTPFQSIVVNSISRHVHSETITLYHPTTSSPKHRSYYESLATTEKYWIDHERVTVSDTLSEAFRWLAIPAVLRRRRFHSILAASVGSIILGMLAERNPESRFYSFDDGTFNLRPEIYFPWIEREPLARRLVKGVVGGGTTPGLMARSGGHFTGYPARHVVGDHPYIAELDLFGARLGNRRPGDGPRARVRVLLGTVIRDPQKKIWQRTFSRRFDVFVPHPADDTPMYVSERLSGIVNPERLRDRIAEDVVAVLIDEGHLPVLYGFNSSALYNLAPYTPTISLTIDGRVGGEVARDIGVFQLSCLIPNEPADDAAERGHRS